MLIRIPNVLTRAQIEACHGALQRADWTDGKVSAGPLTKAVKTNMQVPAGHPAGQRLGEMILGALKTNALFMRAALPLKIVPPSFNRYAGGQSYGNHVDATVQHVWGSADRIRTDLSATLFLSAPEDYDGGELTLDDELGPRAIKLPAGDMVLYPATSVHHVTPVTRGARLAAFFWMQSMVRDDAKRTLLFELGSVLHDYEEALPEHPALVRLTGVYYNLFRRWTDTS
jgi:PKHD-type hydroxylase